MTIDNEHTEEPITEEPISEKPITKEPIIEFKGVSKSFGDRNILDRIDF
jgi:ABC-type molybdenum transport system ATPase subunit/photorepair protein PhrA